MDISIANDEDDCKHATDYHIITVKGTSIGCRLRKGIKFFYDWHDVTFRASRPSGVQTELEKIKRGSPRWYLYGWVDTNDRITHWVFLDMDIFRNSGIIDNPDKVKTNFDQTTFNGYDVCTLYKNKCLKRFSKPVKLFLDDCDQSSILNCSGVSA
jgi:hypothetical protein